MNPALTVVKSTDPAATARWAAGLPYSPETDGIHPAALPLRTWRQRDPEAFATWMKTQPSAAQWIPHVSHE